MENFLKHSENLPFEDTRKPATYTKLGSVNSLTSFSPAASWDCRHAHPSGSCQASHTSSPVAAASPTFGQRYRREQLVAPEEKN